MVTLSCSDRSDVSSESCRVSDLVLYLKQQLHGDVQIKSFHIRARRSPIEQREISSFVEEICKMLCASSRQCDYVKGERNT